MGNKEQSTSQKVLQPKRVNQTEKVGELDLEKISQNNPKTIGIAA